MDDEIMEEENTDPFYGLTDKDIEDMWYLIAKETIAETEDETVKSKMKGVFMDTFLHNNIYQMKCVLLAAKDDEALIDVMCNFHTEITDTIAKAVLKHHNA
jgi:vacuolar-type H+-ATPase catalytic subunit A/Vma1